MAEGEKALAEAKSTFDNPLAEPESAPQIAFFLNDPATTEIYTLSLHDALPICPVEDDGEQHDGGPGQLARDGGPADEHRHRSEEHTSELQSHHDLVCRLLL